MKKLTVAALAVTTLLSGSAFAHEAGEFLCVLVRRLCARQKVRAGHWEVWGI